MSAFLSNSISVPRVTELGNDTAANQMGDLLNSLGNGACNAKAKLVRDAGERHPIVTWILLFVHVFNDSLGHMSADHFDELLFLEVLIRRPDIEYGAGDPFGRRIEDEFNCAGRVSRMHVGAPELLTEHFEVLSGQHLQGKFVNREIEPHARGNTKDGSKAHGRGAPIRLRMACQEGLFDSDFCLRIKRYRT